MPEIILENVTKRWGKFYAVENLNLKIADNSFVTLLGPSGCGKTTTLRMIAGLETPTSGRIVIGDKVVFDSEQGINIPANKRKVGFLFQNYALWPNMTVYQNISFGLSNIKEEMPQIDHEAKNAARLAEILASPKEVADILEDCRDKKGVVDQKKAYIKLIDAFTISMYTAKELFLMKLHEADDMETLAAKKRYEQEEKQIKLLNSYDAKGMSLNSAYEVVKDGKVVTEVRKLNKEEIDLAVRRVSRIVKIGMFMDRYPSELSGGQQQRVAIARTLAPEPSVLFMDEPLSNLDAKLRLEMRYELQRLHVETGSTFVYVTHDQMEAMTLATRICLINNGVLQQYATPLDVYNMPDNLFVADFVGNPSMNFIEAKGKQNPDGTLSLRVLDNIDATFTTRDAIDIAAWQRRRDAESAASESSSLAHSKEKSFVEKSNKDEVFHCHIAKVEEEDASIAEDPVITDEDFIIGVRPEFIELSDNGALPAVIYGAMPTGMESTLKLRIGDYLLTGVVFGASLYAIGAKTSIDFSGDKILLFDRKSGRYIASGSLKA